MQKRLPAPAKNMRSETLVSQTLWKLFCILPEHEAEQICEEMTGELKDAVDLATLMQASFDARFSDSRRDKGA